MQYLTPKKNVEGRDCNPNEWMEALRNCKHWTGFDKETQQTKYYFIADFISPMKNLQIKPAVEWFGKWKRLCYGVLLPGYRWAQLRSCGEADYSADHQSSVSIRMVFPGH